MLVENRLHGLDRLGLVLVSGRLLERFLVAWGQGAADKIKRVRNALDLGGQGLQFNFSYLGKFASRGSGHGNDCEESNQQGRA